MRLTFFLSVLFVFLGLALIYAFLADIVSPMIIRLDPIREKSILGSRADLLRLAVTGLALIFANGLIAKALRRDHRFAGLILLWTGALITFLILVVVGGIIIIN